MSKNAIPISTRYLRLALILMGLWAVSWSLLMVMPETCSPLNVPLITWGHISLGVLAVAFGFGSVFLLEDHENTP